MCFKLILSEAPLWGFPCWVLWRCVELPTFSEDPLTHSWNPTASFRWSSRQTLKEPREGRSWIPCIFVSCHRGTRGNFPDEAVTCLDSTTPNTAYQLLSCPAYFLGQLVIPQTPGHTCQTLKVAMPRLEGEKVQAQPPSYFLTER